MLRPPSNTIGTNIGRHRKGKNVANFTNDNKEENIRPQHFFNNPVSAFLATLSSIIFWCTHCLAKALIVIAGILVMISFICPHKLIGLFNRFIDQQKVEKRFREEL